MQAHVSVDMKRNNTHKTYPNARVQIRVRVLVAAAHEVEDLGARLADVAVQVPRRDDRHARPDHRAHRLRQCELDLLVALRHAWPWASLPLSASAHLH